MLIKIRYTAMAMAFALSPLCVQMAQAHEDASFNADPVVLSFSTVGDSRQDINPAKKADPTQKIFTDANGDPVAPQQDAIWHQSTKAISRIISEIEHQRSDFLFFNGDMIMGYGDTGELPDPDTLSKESIVNSDLVREYKEYAFWRGMVSGMMEKGTYVVPVPGNHEMQCSYKVNENCSGKAALVENENSWRDNMGDLILDNERLTYMFGHAPSYEDVTDDKSDPSRFAIDQSDGRTTDQSKLSYSFDFNGSHFAVIDTDPAGNDGTAPVAWLTKDLADARARGMQHMFVFGHKPAFTYHFDPSDPTHLSGFDKNPDNRDAFWTLIEQYKATYFCGHEHIYNMSQPTKDQGGKAWQVLVGSGGSPFEADLGMSTVNPQTDRDYAWATVRVHRSGNVDISVYGFDDQFGKTKDLQTVNLPR